MNKLYSLSSKFLLVSFIYLQSSLIAGPVVSKFFDESLREVNFFIACYIEQQKMVQQQDLLHHAILVNNKQLIKSIIDQNHQKLLNTRDENGDTSLHYAAEQKSVSTVDLLLLSGANPSIVNNNKELPFHIAVQSQQSGSIMKKLSPESKNKKQMRLRQERSCF